MRLILYKWGGFNDDVLEIKLNSLGHEVFILNTPCKDFNTDMDLAGEIISIVHSKCISGLISFNFFPIIATACNAIGIPYYSWVFDSPHLTLYSEAVKYDTNHIGIFDNDLVEELQSKGVKTCFHLPLAVDVKTLDGRIANAHSRKRWEAYKYDVSFIGSLYTDKARNTYYEDFLLDKDFCNEETVDDIKCFNECIENQAFCYDRDFVVNNDTVNYELLARYMRSVGAVLGPDYFADEKMLVINEMLDRKVTATERQRLLSELSRIVMGSRFGLYTNSDTSYDAKVNSVNKGVVDYSSEMPYIFRKSKINLNITLRSIRTGIPLRALDIIGCGGFLLTNPQRELFDCFIAGRDIEVFCSLEECIEKIKYYVDADTKREQIAQNGRNIALESFSYERLLPILLEG